MDTVREIFDNMCIEQLKFPIGKFHPPENYSESIIKNGIQTIDDFPKKIFRQVDGLTKKELNWIYRPGGWTIKQVIHHCTDSHINSYIRFKRALTEKKPIVGLYREELWAELSDYQNEAIEDTLEFLSVLHQRWVTLLKAISPIDLNRVFVHPEEHKEITLKENIFIYAWHCRHHEAHIKQAIKAKGVF